MKIKKKIISILLSAMIILSVISVEKITETNVKADTAFVITSPKSNALVAAGHIDITWSSASEQGTVKNYKVYVDGKLEKSTISTTYEFYTTKVNYHTVWIVAEFTDGDKISTPSLRFGVTKKGLCVHDGMGRYVKPTEIKAGWYYDWGTEPLPYVTYSSTEFVPMIWGPGANYMIPTVAKKGYKYLLSYNEPDMNGAGGGCNISVQTGINNWKYFQGYDFYVSSPAPAFSPTWGNGTWLRDFMSSIDQSTADFIPLHCYYGGWAGKAAAEAFLKEVVDDTYNMYHKPIWITEFAPSGLSPNVQNQKNVKEFLEVALKGLDERDYVERYSWFSFDTSDKDNGASALWTHQTGVLTDLGKAYTTNGNPTTNYVAGKEVNNYKHEKTKVVIQKTTVKKPAKAKIKSAKNLKGKKIKLSLKKIKNAVGYQIRICDNSKFNGYWGKSIKKTSYTIKKLDKNTKYYIKARAYVMNKKKKLYGSWSKVKKVKVKK